jgi:serine protease Do
MNIPTFTRVLMLTAVLTLGCNIGSTLSPFLSSELGAVSSLEEIKSAIVQIEAQGSFIDPEVGLLQNVAGRGSGFIIDEAGIAVTNNHVVRGAAFLRVWVGGERTPRNAQVLGVSECSDLAVIDIDGDGYPYMEWFDDPTPPGLVVFAAGFPLGDPEFTLTRGIISKAQVRGETNWASVDAVVEHDATINPGNSGGPLVSEDGQVIGVNYAGNPSARQQFAIARDEALQVIELLRAGQDINSIGVNGTAVNDNEGLSGIWVSSVQSGTPADKAGVQAGDIITRLERLVLATDGTMADYCDILRGHASDDTLGIEVLRFETEEVLEGQLNGRELELSFSFARELEEEFSPVADESESDGEDDGESKGDGEGTDSATYGSYITVTDDSGAIAIDIPREWNDVDGSPWEVEGEVVGATIAGSSDLESFFDSVSTPGVFFGASRKLAQKYEDNLDELIGSLSQQVPGDCTPEGRYNYNDPLYTGLFNLFTGCDEDGAVVIVVAATPEDQSFVILVGVQAVSEADLNAADHILDTFRIIGDLP